MRRLRPVAQSRQLLYLHARPPACLVSQMLREGLPLQNPPFSLLCCPPQQRFLGWFRGRAQSLMFFDHVFSLSHREAKGLELRRRGLFVVTECLGARPPLCASAH